MWCFQDDSFVVLALHCAASEGNVSGLQELLTLSAVDVNATNKVLIRFLPIMWHLIMCCCKCIMFSTQLALLCKIYLTLYPNTMYYFKFKKIRANFCILCCVAAVHLK